MIRGTLRYHGCACSKDQKAQLKPLSLKVNCKLIIDLENNKKMEKNG